MPASVEIRNVQKGAAVKELGDSRQSAIAKYRGFFVGEPGLWPLLRYELVTMLCCGRAGAVGFLLRKILIPKTLHKCGRGVQWGKNISFRHPFKMEFGDGTVVDEACLLDARGTTVGGFKIGEQVLIARNVVIQSKTDAGFIEIGGHCSIGNSSTISSAGGIRIGSHVMLAGHCYVGGGRYQTDRDDIPMMQQPMYSKGVVSIGNDCWLGAGARVLDGAKIGDGSVIGAAALVTGEIPPRSIAIGVPARVIGVR